MKPTHKLKSERPPKMPKETPENMIVAGTNVTITLPNQQPALLGEGTLVRFYVNDAQQQLIGYLGDGVVSVSGSDLVFNVVLGEPYTGVPEPHAPTPSDGYAVEMEVDPTGVGESWIQVTPTSDVPETGITWTVDEFYNCVSLQA